MSRSFGDQIAHSCGVTEVPEIKIMQFDPSVHKGVILASDGIWEHIQSQQACKLIENEISCNQADIAVDILVLEALQKWKTVSS